MCKSIPLAGASPQLSRQGFSFRRIALAVLAVTPATIGAAAAPAFGQETANVWQPQILVTPYLWLSGIYGTIQTPIERAQTVNVNVGPFEVLGDLVGAPFMGSAEVRFGPFGLLGDVLHVPLSAPVSTHDVAYQGGHVGLTANTGTAVALYRFLDAPNQFADFGGGFRAWGFEADVELNPGLRPGAATKQKAGWGDPLLAGRYHYDFGGFGLGAHTDWQVMGTVDYALNSRISLRAGYRSLNFNYTTEIGSVGFNIHMRGPIFAGTLRF